jgi:hypothetical protein
MQILSTVLELFGIACLAMFAWFVWPPAVLLVAGVAAVAIGVVQGGERR